MIKVIKKQSYNGSDNGELLISPRDIVAIDTGSSIVLTQPVKGLIDITYDEQGCPDVDLVDLGVQYDHRVTWLHFNLNRLLWHLNEEKGYDENTKYNYYTFKLAFSRVGDSESQVWEFDGRDFEVPRAITKYAGTYELTLIVEEYQKDDFVGNIKVDSPEYLERFVTKSMKGRVTKSFFNPSIDIEATMMETDQKASLVKPAIKCILADNGTFIPETNELGQKQDSFTRYLKFNPGQITAHLNDFFVFAIYKQGEKFYSSMFEITSPDDPFDDYSDSDPIITWVPKEVFQYDGTWEVAIIACAGNMEQMNNGEDGNGDYYFFVSLPARMKVIKNRLTIEDVTKDPIISVTSNLLTGLGELIITSEDEVYEASQEDSK